MNGKNAEILKYKRRATSNGKAVQFVGPGDVEAAAKEYNSAAVFTDMTAIDANTTVTRYIEDSWNGESFFVLHADDVSAVQMHRREVPAFAGFLRVRHEVKHTSEASAVGSTFGCGLTYKQT